MKVLHRLFFAILLCSLCIVLHAANNSSDSSTSGNSVVNANIQDHEHQNGASYHWNYSKHYNHAIYGEAAPAPASCSGGEYGYLNHNGSGVGSYYTAFELNRLASRSVTTEISGWIAIVMNPHNAVAYSSTWLSNSEVNLYACDKHTLIKSIDDTSE